MNITYLHSHFQKRRKCYTQLKRIYERITISPQLDTHITKQKFQALGWYCPKCNKIVDFEKVNKEPL